jgi:hypothetical protein
MTFANAKKKAEEQAIREAIEMADAPTQMGIRKRKAMAKKLAKNVTEEQKRKKEKTVKKGKEKVEGMEELFKVGDKEVREMKPLGGESFGMEDTAARIRRAQISDKSKRSIEIEKRAKALQKQIEEEKLGGGLVSLFPAASGAGSLIIPTSPAPAAPVMGVPPTSTPVVKSRAKQAEERMTSKMLRKQKFIAESGAVGKVTGRSEEEVEKSKRPPILYDNELLTSGGAVNIPMVKFDKKRLSQKEQDALERVMRHGDNNFYKIYKEEGKLPKTVWDTFAKGQQLSLREIEGLNLKEVPRTIAGIEIPGRSKRVVSERIPVAVAREQETVSPELRKSLMKELTSKESRGSMMFLEAKKKAEAGKISGAKGRTYETAEIETQKAAGAKKAMRMLPSAFEPGVTPKIGTMYGQTILTGGKPGEKPIVQLLDKHGQPLIQTRLAGPSAIGVKEFTEEQRANLAAGRAEALTTLERQLSLYRDQKKAAKVAETIYKKQVRGKPKNGYQPSVISKGFAERYPKGSWKLRINREPHKDYTFVYLTVVAPVSFVKKDRQGNITGYEAPYSNRSAIDTEVEKLLGLMNMRIVPGEEITDVISPKIVGNHMYLKWKVKAQKY